VYSRVTQLEIDTLRIGVDDAVEIYRNEVVPLLHEQEGYLGAYVFTTPEGKGMLISFWETEAQAHETPFYSGVIMDYVTLFRAPPGRESYEVRYADAPVAAA
jgi:hypothetical protein